MIKFGNKKDNNTNIKCTVRLLDDSDVIECEFQSFHKGRFLLDFVFNHLNLIETDYFGLRYIDQNKQRHWLDANKNILRQIKSLNPILFCFRVKFYPAEPLRLHEEITRYYLFLQLRRDLLHGRLYCVQNDAAVLGAYIVQADYGDANAAVHSVSYVSEYKILLKQSPKMEEKIGEIHKSLKGLSPPSAELYFLKKASTLDTYGVDPYSVKDHRGVHLYLGLSHAGVLTFQGSKRTHHFRWNEVQKLNYEGKMFIVHLIFMEDARTKRKHMVGFKCSSASACRNLWRSAVEQRLFYSMSNSNKQGMVVTGGSFFSRGSRFRYQGRCEKEVIEDSATIARDPPSVKRIPLKNIGRSTSLPTTPADSDTYETVIGRVHRPLPYIDRSTSLDEEVLCDAESPTPAHDLYVNGSYPGGAYCPESTLPPLRQLESLPEDKFHESAITEGNFIDPEASNDLGYYERHSQSFPPLTTIKENHNLRENSDPSKRLYRHPAIKDDDFLSQQLFCDCDDQRPEYERDESSSTETLGPPTEPLDTPFPKPDPSGPPQRLVQTPNPTSNKDSKIKARVELAPKHAPLLFHTRRNGLDFRVKPFSLFVSTLCRFSRVFAVTFILVILVLGAFTVVVFETGWTHLEELKSSREMVLLRVQYYEPLKRYIAGSVIGGRK